MKWPATLTIFRHAQTTYNALRDQKAKDPEYSAFKEEFEKNYRSEETRTLATRMKLKYALKKSDHQTPLSREGRRQSVETGRSYIASKYYVRPDVILVSPHLRTCDTFAGMQKGGFDVGDAKVVIEDRIREQEHGLSLLYSDWRIFHTYHPEQKRLYDLEGAYWYRYPNGESVSDVRERIRSVTDTIIREYAGLNVCLITHHLTKLSIRANFERLTPEEFMRLDREEKPINCGVTIYRGNPNAGSDGKLELVTYNTKLY